MQLGQNKPGNANFETHILHHSKAEKNPLCVKSYLDAVTPTGYGHHPSYAEKMRLKIKNVDTDFLPQRLQLRAAHTLVSM